MLPVGESTTLIIRSNSMGKVSSHKKQLLAELSGVDFPPGRKGFYSSDQLLKSSLTRPDERAVQVSVL
jgi:hypothetical protein